MFVESESKRIGTLQVPDDLMVSMRDSECVWVETDTSTRVTLLKEQYAHFLADPAALSRQLDCLLQLHGRAAIERWQDLAHGGEWDALVRELLERHYDPAYTRSIASHYRSLARAQTVAIESCDGASFMAAARALIKEPAAAMG